MIVKRTNKSILMLQFSDDFYELGIMNSVDKYGREWSFIMDPESNLFCLECQAEKVFPDNSVLESHVKYISSHDIIKEVLV